MYRVEGVPRHYAWGSKDAIHNLLGTTPDAHPLAELWYGGHTSGPATLRTEASDGKPATTTADNVADLIDLDAATTLGTDVTARFGTQLPYLLKLIAPASPLSLQVHPSLEHAEQRFAAENAAGIPLDSPLRNYRDANHKPELIYALETFEALSGFRAHRRAAELLRGLDASLAQTLHEILSADPTAGGMRRAFTALLSEETRPTEQQIAELVEACAHRLAHNSPSLRADGTVRLLAENFGHDPGVVASLLLNPVTLQPGDAMFIPAGGVHAYLSGLGVEVMASSDNVLRAGLTTKHIDVAEMLACIDYVAAPPLRIAPETFHDATEVFYAPVDDFELSVTTLGPEAGTRPQPLAGRGPRMLLCLDGVIEVASVSDSLALERGEAAFITAAQGALTIQGQGRLVQADVP